MNDFVYKRNKKKKEKKEQKNDFFKKKKGTTFCVACEAIETLPFFLIL